MRLYFSGLVLSAILLNDPPSCAEAFAVGGGGHVLMRIRRHLSSTPSHLPFGTLARSLPASLFAAAAREDQRSVGGGGDKRPLAEEIAALKISLESATTITASDMKRRIDGLEREIRRERKAAEEMAKAAANLRWNAENLRSRMDGGSVGKGKGNPLFPNDKQKGQKEMNLQVQAAERRADVSQVLAEQMKSQVMEAEKGMADLRNRIESAVSANVAGKSGSDESDEGQNVRQTASATINRNQNAGVSDPKGNRDRTAGKSDWVSKDDSDQRGELPTPELPPPPFLGDRRRDDLENTIESLNGLLEHQKSIVARLIEENEEERSAWEKERQRFDEKRLIWAKERDELLEEQESMKTEAELAQADLELMKSKDEEIRMKTEALKAAKEGLKERKKEWKAERAQLYLQIAELTSSEEVGDDLSKMLEEAETKHAEKCEAFEKAQAALVRERDALKRKIMELTNTQVEDVREQEEAFRASQLEIATERRQWEAQKDSLKEANEALSKELESVEARLEVVFEEAELSQTQQKAAFKEAKAALVSERDSLKQKILELEDVRAEDARLHEETTRTSQQEFATERTKWETQKETLEDENAALSKEIETIEDTLKQTRQEAKLSQEKQSAEFEIVKSDLIAERDDLERKIVEVEDARAEDARVVEEGLLASQQEFTTERAQWESQRDALKDENAALAKDLEAVQANLEMVSQEAGDAVRLLRADLEDRGKEREQDLAQWQADKEAFEGEKQNLFAQIESLEQEYLERSDRERDEHLAQLQEEREAFEGEKLNLFAQIESLEQDYLERSDREREEHLAQLQEEREVFEEEKQSLFAQIESLEQASIENLEKSNAEIKEDIAKWQKEKNELEKDNQALLAQIESLEHAKLEESSGENLKGSGVGNEDSAGWLAEKKAMEEEKQALLAKIESLELTHKSEGIRAKPYRRRAPFGSANSDYANPSDIISFGGP